MKIILGVSGCIAAYKAAEIVRLLQTTGAEVFPVMTRHASEFITPLTLEKLTGNPVLTDQFRTPTPEIEHISLARRSDLLLVAPATANVLGKFANGVADDLLSTLFLSTVTPVVIAPAMNVEMWRHPAVQENLKTLRRFGVEILDPGSGYLACGEIGEGRLVEPEAIVAAVLNKLKLGSGLSGRSLLITAGPTVEDIDPVRFISNRSSGKMGYALAAQARRRGAAVTLISGPTSLEAPRDVEFVPVRGAAQMAEAVQTRFPECEVLIMAAAVSDFTPRRTAGQKIKKTDRPSVLELEQTEDILQAIRPLKSQQVVVGFAAESDKVLEGARAKLEAKDLDLMVANDISRSDIGFGSDKNQAVLIQRDREPEELPMLSKSELADLILDRVESILSLKSSTTSSLRR